MAASLQSLLLALESIGVTPQLRGTENGPSVWLRIQALSHHSRLRRKERGDSCLVTRVRVPVTLAKRRSRSPMSGVERRLRALRRLVPNGEAGGIVELFGEAADYIARLEMQVKVMRILVQVLEGSHE